MTVLLKLIYVIRVIQYPYTFQTHLSYIASGQQSWYNSHAIILIYLFQCGGKLSVVGDICSRMLSSSSHSLSCISTSWSTRRGFVVILMCQSMSALLYLWECITFWTLGIESFQPSLEVSGELCISSCGIISSSAVKSLAEYVTGQCRLLILVAPSSQHVEDIFHWSPIIKGIREVSVDLAIKGHCI